MSHTLFDIDRHSVIVLTTTGRASGHPHTIEIWFAQKGWTLYLLSGGGHRSDWVRNLLHTPAVAVRADAISYSGTARLVTDAEEERMARDAVYDRYAADHAGDLTRWREAALPIAIDIDVAMSENDQ
ncbi:MAG: nitroreductase family deazaflavin-dependent oxidoreductase [Acidimicrobiia bacterium]